MKSYLKYLFFFSSIILLTSCNEDDTDPTINPYGPTNEWIYGTMNSYYLWNVELPITVDLELEPTDFFNSLKYEGDRYSIIHPDYDELYGRLTGTRLEAGYEFQWLVSSETGRNTFMITYVKKDSPAEMAGLQRGDRITHVNATEIASDNVRTLFGQLGEDHTISVERYVDGQYSFWQDVPLQTIVYEENPNFLDSIYQVDGKKIGYFVYTYFPQDSVDSPYAIELQNIFADFKNEGITDLVVDFRYNGGGYVSAAKNLASYIGTGITDNDVFYESVYNDYYTAYLESLDNHDFYFTQKFRDKEANIGEQISGKVYFIVGSGTASASELVINGLDPYMEVTLIGDRTEGKNVGSTLLRDARNNNNTYALLPIIVRHYNADGYSDFEDGFLPEAQNQVFEFQQPIIPLGDLSEPLLAHTIGLITGQPSAKRIPASSRKTQLRSSSKKMQPFGHTMLENPLPFDLEY